MARSRATKAARRFRKRARVKKQAPRGEKIRLRALAVRNFKILDHLELDFPPPRMEGDPDVFVMGSKNGLGKTSVLESCSVLFLAAASTEDVLGFMMNFPDGSVDLPGLMVKGGTKEAEIQATFLVAGKKKRVGMRLARGGKYSLTGDTGAFRKLVRAGRRLSLNVMETAQRLTLSLAGADAEPLLLPPLMFFHSYRKVQEGNPELGMMLESERSYWRTRHPLRPGLSTSAFKLEILRAMMSRGGLFEDMEDAEAESELRTLNTLIEKYAGGRIVKLRPSPVNAVELRITPMDGGPSFPFDGLSSGQKEVISTLYLIWHYTRHKPSIVLIDEPELHLNAEWRRGFVRHLHKLVPKNQYIIATHSEDIFGSVEKSRRILLGPS